MKFNDNYRIIMEACENDDIITEGFWSQVGSGLSTATKWAGKKALRAVKHTVVNEKKHKEAVIKEITKAFKRSYGFEQMKMKDDKNLGWKGKLDGKEIRVVWIGSDKTMGVQVKVKDKYMPLCKKFEGTWFNYFKNAESAGKDEATGTEMRKAAIRKNWDPEIDSVESFIKTVKSIFEESDENQKCRAIAAKIDPKDFKAKSKGNEIEDDDIEDTSEDKGKGKEQNAGGGEGQTPAETPQTDSKEDEAKK